MRKYKNKIKGHSETLYKNIGVVTKTSIRCKALDASPMFSALFSDATLSISSLSQSPTMGMKFLELRF